jgi:hypothetical protein
MITKSDETRPVMDADRAACVPSRDNRVSPAEQKKVCTCPVCGGKLVYGSYDPCEGYYYWCSACKEGPYLFDRMISQQAPIIVAGPCESQCDVCGKFVCSVRGVGMIGCRDFVSMDIAARAHRDMPPNEPRIRGMVSGQDLARLRFHSRRCD